MIEIKSNEYIFVGHNIKYFITNEPIISYHSVIGNNDPNPYPFALTKNYVYIMSGDHYTQRMIEDPDPYPSYYKHELIYKTKWIRYKNKIIVHRWI